MHGQGSADRPAQAHGRVGMDATWSGPPIRGVVEPRYPVCVSATRAVSGSALLLSNVDAALRPSLRGAAMLGAALPGGPGLASFSPEARYTAPAASAAPAMSARTAIRTRGRDFTLVTAQHSSRDAPTCARRTKRRSRDDSPSLASHYCQTRSTWASLLGKRLAVRNRLECRTDFSLRSRLSRELAERLVLGPAPSEVGT